MPLSFGSTPDCCLILAATCRMIVRVGSTTNEFTFDSLGDRSLAQFTFPHQSPKTDGSQPFPLRSFGNSQLRLFLKNEDIGINHARIFSLFPAAVSFFTNRN